MRPIAGRKGLINRSSPRFAIRSTLRRSCGIVRRNPELPRLSGGGFYDSLTIAGARSQPQGNQLKPDVSARGSVKMVSNQRFYARRAVEEQARAARAMTHEAKAWHRQLAEDFARRAREHLVEGSA